MRKSACKDVVCESISALGDWEDWRDHAEEIREHTLENLDYYLGTIKENVIKLGGNVFFAETPKKKRMIT
ncbi:hypothetical protein KHA80_04555 [Anaerobacillus sp. HL2]|nr:hypothetical protein KHA80_04555 [Anaerobacillus sp. HL2]